MLAGLTTRGRCLLAAGLAAAACSVILNERDLLRVAVFVAALPLLTLLLTQRTKISLSARRDVSPDQVPVGSPATVRLHVRGTGRIPVGGLLLEDGVPYAVGRRPRFVLDRLGRSGASVEYPVQPKLRGIHYIGPLRTRVIDPFGLSELERELADRDRLVAVPQVVRLNGLPAGLGHGNGPDGSLRVHAGHGEDDATVRQYRHGDDMRRVHWKSTARRDELIVRVEERPWRGGATVLLDRRSAAHQGSGATASIEWAISAAASITLHLHRTGRHARLITSDGAVLGGPGAPAGEDRELLEPLAALQPSPQRDMSFGADPGAGQQLIAILGATTQAGVAALTQMRPHGARSLAILLDVRAWAPGSGEAAPDPEEAARRLRAAGWSVVVASGPTATLPELWEQLCRPNTGSPATEVAAR